MAAIAAPSSDAPKAKATRAAPPTAEEYTIGPESDAKISLPLVWESLARHARKGRTPRYRFWSR
jgi:hypothetical protein